VARSLIADGLADVVEDSNADEEDQEQNHICCWTRRGVQRI
jgi:hypothetical protein